MHHGLLQMACMRGARHDLCYVLGVWSRATSLPVPDEAQCCILLGPLCEMAFWRSRHGALSVAYEQLDTASARAVITLLRARSSDRNLLASFHSQHSELVRVRMHAHLFTCQGSPSLLYLWQVVITPIRIFSGRAREEGMADTRYRA